MEVWKYDQVTVYDILRHKTVFVTLKAVRYLTHLLTGEPLQEKTIYEPLPRIGPADKQAEVEMERYFKEANMDVQSVL